MSVAGLILSNLHDGELPSLTGRRTMGAVPIGGRYRMVDFPLSAMVNAAISQIYIIAHHNYQSLMDHLGSGKDWDMARHSGGIHIVPPYSAAFANPTECYDSRIQSLVSIRGLVERIEEEHVLCCDCDAVGVPDFSAFIEAHKKSGMPMTVGTQGQESAAAWGSLHIWIAKTSFLREILKKAEDRHYTSFYTDVVRHEASRGNVGTYPFSQRFYRIHSLSQYYRMHMTLTQDDRVREQLLEDPDHPVFTKIQNAPPVKYGKNARVQGSLIADGCIIEGTVKNSVLFRGVHVGENCVIENSVVLERCHLSDFAHISGAVLDKNVTIGGNTRLAGHPTLPFFVEEGRVIH